MGTLSISSIVIYWESKKQLTWLEDNITLESNLAHANLGKVMRYANLKSNLKLKHNFAIQIIVLICIRKSIDYGLRKVMFSSRQIGFIKENDGTTYLNLSYFVWNTDFCHSFTKPTLVVETKTEYFHITNTKSNYVCKSSICDKE